MHRLYTALSTAALAALMVSAPATAQEQSRFGVDASEWDSATVAVANVLIPIGGAGQVNGQFVTGERYGVQVGIRAQDRFVGPLQATRAKHTGVYAAAVGFSSLPATAAKWNYDLHIDLRNAQGVAAGKTLGDYTLTLDSDIGSHLGPCAFPCDLATFLPPSAATVVLLQSSSNPTFGVFPAFDPAAEESYSFTLMLTPKTFNGPPITARMRVDVQ